MKKKLSKKGGFTLIELIVVIAILGVLMLIAIPRLGAFRESAQNKANLSTAATIYKSAQIYFAENGDLEGFDVTKFIDKNDFDSGKMSAIALNADGNDVAPVTYDGQTWPEGGTPAAPGGDGET